MTRNRSILLSSAIVLMAAFYGCTLQRSGLQSDPGTTSSTSGVATQTTGVGGTTVATTTSTQGAGGAGGVVGVGGAAAGGAGAAGGSGGCNPGTTEPCYAGPAKFAGVGLCVMGKRKCKSDGTGYGACEGSVLPALEVCGNGKDEDCDGADATAAGTCLHGNGLVVRYMIDEAASGNAPKKLLDSAPQPRSLDVIYGSMQFTEIAGNRGLSWSKVGVQGRAETLIDGTKIHSMLNGSKFATFEVVMNVTAIQQAWSNVLLLGTPGESRFSLYAHTNGHFDIAWKGKNFIDSAYIKLTMAGRMVMHIVVDSREQTAAERVRWYKDGVRMQELAELDAGKLALDETIELGTGASLVLGNNPSGGYSMAGHLYYAAVYAVPLSEPTIKHHSVTLLANDDGI